jgi:hypothetical protein
MSEGVEQIPVDNARTFCLTGRRVTFELIEKMAVLCLDLLGVDAGVRS